MIQVVIGPLAFNERLLRPRPAQSLGFDLPKPSYMSFGCLSLTQEDISNQSAMIAIEHDAGFCRVDSLNSFDEAIARL